jgi:DNA-binding Lrp family transcriptional regulator
MVDDASEINTALTELIKKECVVYLKRSNDFLKLKDSSGVDIPSEIVNYIEKNRAVMQVKAILNQSSFDSFMYPTRYNDEYEITRYFDFTFINGSDFLEVDDWEKRIEDIEADGVVYAIIPENETEITKLNIALSKLKTGVERIVFIVPNKHSDIEKLALEYQAVKKLRSFIINDDLLADEYDIYLDDLTEVLNSYINTFVHPETSGSTYYHCGKKQKIYRRSQLSELLSHICEIVFSQTPVINNESINKNYLPTVAVNSRTKILSGLLATELAPSLGLTGTGQDVSIMRSTLIQTEVVQNVDSKPTINLEPSNENLTAVLRIISNFFNNASSNNGSNFGELYENLTLPKYHIGLKRGLIPIYVAVVLHLYKQNIVVKYKNEEIKITPDLLNEINESPSDYSVILDDWNEEKAAYLAGLEKIFSSYISEREKAYNGFAFIQLAMNRWYMDLPKYARDFKEIYVGIEEKSKSLDKQRKGFINSLKQLDNNPREYLLVKLFSIFKITEVSANILNIIESTKSEFDNAIPNLITTLIADVKSIFMAKQKKATLTSVLKDWCETLSKDTLQHLFPQNENRILDLMKALSNDESAIIQRLAKAVTGLRIEDWSNDTIKLFITQLQKFKQIVEDYNIKKNNSIINTDEYKLTFKADGEEVVKSFSKAKYSPKAKLLLNEITSAIEEMGEAVTEQEKRQVLIDVLQKLC